MPRRRRSTLVELKLLVGASHGDLGALRYALEFGVPPDLLDHRGQTALWRACHAGNVEAVDLLLAAGANPDLAPLNGRTPLYMAAFIGVPFEPGDRLVERLLAAGANPETADDMGVTPLMQALHRPSRVQALLRAGADPEARTSLMFKCASVLTMMMLNDAHQRDSLRLLLDAGADPNGLDGNGRTPLMLALDKPSGWTLIDLLLEAGADPDLVAPRFGRSPRERVEASGDPAMRVPFERYELRRALGTRQTPSPTTGRSRL